ncbi:MAG TPA: site-specific integrase [Candidatus Limiplasma sp.]|nr:site-specific integrase [Candidatus Limiplasma sp.]
MSRHEIKEGITIKQEVVSAAPNELTQQQLDKNLKRFHTFQRGLFGENHEAGSVVLKHRVTREDNLIRLKKEFLLSRQGKHDADKTLKAYECNFNRIYDFIGFNYLRQGMEQVDDAIDREIGTKRDIGASMPIYILESENFSSYYHDYLSNTSHLAEQTILSAMRHYRAIIYFAQEEGLIKPFDIKIKEIAPPIKDTFSKYELEQIVKKPKKESFIDYRCWVMIKYLMATGNRVSSMLALDVKDIDFEDGGITVNIQKNKKPKLMPLHPDLRKVLKEFINYYRCDKDGDPYYNEPLFCNAYGARLAYNSARDAMEDYFCSRGVVWEGFHKFRHSYAANWIRDGGNPFMLKEQLGHSTLAMTNRYANIYGMATKQESEEHSLISKVREKAGRKQIKIRKG